jgi:hypothetical protein
MQAVEISVVIERAQVRIHQVAFASQSTLTLMGRMADDFTWNTAQGRSMKMRVCALTVQRGKGLYEPDGDMVGALTHLQEFDAGRVDIRLQESEFDRLTAALTHGRGEHSLVLHVIGLRMVDGTVVWTAPLDAALPIETVSFCASLFEQQLA